MSRQRHHGKRGISLRSQISTLAEKLANLRARQRWKLARHILRTLKAVDKPSRPRERLIKIFILSLTIPLIVTLLAGGILLACQYAFWERQKEPTATPTPFEKATPVTATSTPHPLQTPTVAPQPSPTPGPPSPTPEPPSPTPRPCPTRPAWAKDGPFTYAVQQGDTPGWLASCFGIALEALERANDLKDDIIYEDQTLLIPALPGRVISEDETNVATTVDMHNETIRDYLLEPSPENYERLRELTADSFVLEKVLWFADHLRNVLSGNPTCVSYSYFHAPEAVLTGPADAITFSSEKWIYERDKGETGIDRITDEFSVFEYRQMRVEGFWRVVRTTSSFRAKSRGQVQQSACNGT